MCQGWQVNVFVHENYATNGDQSAQEAAIQRISPDIPIYNHNSNRYMTDKDNKHKGGRPKAVKGKARTKTISTWLTLAEWKTVMKRITDAGKNPSHFLRELLLYGKVVAARTQEDRKQIRMLEGGCNNLNQLAKLAHQQGFPRTKARIMDLLDEFNQLIERI